MNGRLHPGKLVQQGVHQIAQLIDLVAKLFVSRCRRHGCQERENVTLHRKLWRLVDFTLQWVLLCLRGVVQQGVRLIAQLNDLVAKLFVRRCRRHGCQARGDSTLHRRLWRLVDFTLHWVLLCLRGKCIVFVKVDVVAHRGGPLAVAANPGIQASSLLVPANPGIHRASSLSNLV